MSIPAHLPPQSERHDPQYKFAPFPRSSHEDWLTRVLNQLTIRNVDAILYRCTPRWTLAERRINDDMFLYVIKGRLLINTAGRNAVVNAGQSAHFRRGMPHSAATDPKLPMHIISLHYTATVFESLTLPELLQFPNVFDFAGDRPLDTLFHTACREYALRPAGYERALEALVARLLFHLIHERGDWLQTPTSESKLADLRRLLPAHESMRANLASPISVPDLARRCGFSESQFRRVFQRTMGMLPVQHLRQVRMEHACQLLRQTDQTVDGIATQVGYAETAFFSHTFKRLIGMSPGKYRAAHEL